MLNIPQLTRAAALSLASFAGQASAQDLELCGQAAIQTSCITSCASACNDVNFLAQHTSFCLNNNLIGANPILKPDAPMCATLFSPPEPEPVIEEAVEEDAVDDECDSLPSLSQRRRCALAKVTPDCASTVTELEGQSRLLVTEIGLETAQYGELLQRDWSDVNNRELLCNFSLATLDRNYEIASENPERLRALQRQATAIQSCQSEWETWVRDRAASQNANNQSGDKLIDQVTRDAEKQLIPLKEKIAGLSQSIEKLEDAANIIVGIVDVHLFYCAPEGNL